MLSEANWNLGFRNIVNRADIVSPDGKPLSVLMRYQYGIPQERACGMDLFPDILQQADEKGLTVFLYGSTDDLLQTIITKAEQQYSNKVIAGAYAPLFVR